MTGYTKQGPFLRDAPAIGTDGVRVTKKLDELQEQMRQIVARNGAPANVLVDSGTYEEIRIVQEDQLQQLYGSWRIIETLPTTKQESKYDQQNRYVTVDVPAYKFVVGRPTPPRVTTVPPPITPVSLEATAHHHEEEKTVAEPTPEKKGNPTVNMLKKNFANAAKVGGAAAVNKLLVRRAREMIKAMCDGKMPAFFETPAGEHVLCVLAPTLLHLAATQFLPEGPKTAKIAAVADYAHQGASIEAVAGGISVITAFFEGLMSDVEKIVDVEALPAASSAAELREDDAEERASEKRAKKAEKSAAERA